MSPRYSSNENEQTLLVIILIERYVTHTHCSISTTDVRIQSLFR